MPNPVLKNWLTETWTPSVIAGNSLNEEYKYNSSIYKVFVAAEALTAGIPCYQFASVGGAVTVKITTSAAATRQRACCTPIVSVASGDAFWGKVTGPREYKPNGSDFLDPVLVVGAGGAIIEGDVLMAGATGGKFDEIGATEEEYACGTAGASESGGTLANYTLNFNRINAT